MDPAAEHRLEELTPAAIRRQLLRRPLAYVPLGALEYHGEHAPIGLDGLTAHGLCLRAAVRTGGVVFPPHFQGLWASLGHQPWTFLAEDEAAWRQPLDTLLRRLEAQGVKQTVLFSGHFSLQQLAAMQALRTGWEAHPRAMRLLTLAINGLPDPPFPPDHGGRFETSVLHALRPDLVRLERLPPLATHPAVDPGGQLAGPQRRDPAHPLFGVLGADPRDLDPGQAADLADRLVTWLVREVGSAN